MAKANVFSLETLLTDADDILRDIATDHVPYAPGGKEFDPGFASSFFDYIAGSALTLVTLFPWLNSLTIGIDSAKATYHFEKGDQICREIKDKDLPDTAAEEYRKSVSYYLQAAAKYPDDDELHVCA
jgi:hypothetical protein